MNTAHSEADKEIDSNSEDARKARIQLQQVQSSFQVIWLIVLMLSASRWICYLSFLEGGDFLVELLLCCVPSCTIAQLTIATVALSWRVGNTKEGWQRFRKRAIALIATELVIVGLLGVYFYGEGHVPYGLDIFANPEGVFLGCILIPIAMLLLHALPVYFLIDFCRRQGYEVVNTKLTAMPREAIQWKYQFRIRDLMIITLLASIVLAIVQFMDKGIVGSDLRHVFSEHMLVIAIGFLGILLMIAIASFQGSRSWFWQILGMMMLCVVMSVMQIAFVDFGFGILPLIVGHLIVNELYLLILVIVWKLLESSGWRIIREGEAVSG